MKIEKDASHFEIYLGRWEAMILRHVLGFYPLLNPDYHRLSHNPDSKTASGQKLLEEAMTEQHRKIKASIDAIMKPLQETNSDLISLRLDVGQMEQFLKALNDVRVGSWVRLGKPDTQNRDALPVDEASAAYFPVMEVSGHFEMELLRALQG